MAWLLVRTLVVPLVLGLLGASASDAALRSSLGRTLPADPQQQNVVDLPMRPQDSTLDLAGGGEVVVDHATPGAPA